MVNICTDLNLSINGFNDSNAKVCELLFLNHRQKILKGMIHFNANVFYPQQIFDKFQKVFKPSILSNIEQLFIYHHYDSFDQDVILRHTKKLKTLSICFTNQFCASYKRDL